MKIIKVIPYLAAILWHSSFINCEDNRNEGNCTIIKLSFLILYWCKLLECKYWDDMCESLKNSEKTDYKKCISKTIYYYSPVKAKWPMARFYCQSIFNGYRSADLLYLNTKNDWNLFRDEFFSKLTNPPTGMLN